MPLELKWSLTDLISHNYLEESESLRPLYDLAEKGNNWTWNTDFPCFSKEELEAGTYVSICDHQNIQSSKSTDFSETGKCNYYTIEETFFTTPQVMAFQVGKNST